MERTAYESRLKNLHSWASHMGTSIEDVIPRVLAELGPPGEERPEDLRSAAELLGTVAECLGDVMGAFDLLLEAVSRPRRYDDMLQGLEIETKAAGEEKPGNELRDLGPIDHARFARLSAELHYDAGWLLGAIHGAMVCHGEFEHLDAHLDGLASGIDEVMISYDRLQDLIGVMPARHNAFFDRMVVLEEVRRRRHPHQATGRH